VRALLLLLLTRRVMYALGSDMSVSASIDSTVATTSAVCELPLLLALPALRASAGAASPAAAANGLAAMNERRGCTPGGTFAAANPSSGSSERNACGSS
jgi:hypothetical protein